MPDAKRYQSPFLGAVVGSSPVVQRQTTVTMGSLASERTLQMHHVRGCRFFATRCGLVASSVEATRTRVHFQSPGKARQACSDELTDFFKEIRLYDIAERELKRDFSCRTRPPKGGRVQGRAGGCFGPLPAIRKCEMSLKRLETGLTRRLASEPKAMHSFRADHRSCQPAMTRPPTNTFDTTQLAHARYCFEPEGRAAGPRSRVKTSSGVTRSGSVSLTCRHRSRPSTSTSKVVSRAMSPPSMPALGCTKP